MQRRKSQTWMISVQFMDELWCERLAAENTALV